MQRHLVCGALLLAASLMACSDEPENACVTPAGPSTAGTPEQQREVDEFLEQTEPQFRIPEPGTEPGKPTFSGEWTNRDGAWECDGYMTRFEDEVHCAATVPEDWTPFEFEGETFYVAPLSVTGTD